jgi:ubiquinone/menaquinone biosynthesis C-methylase UbiE
MTTQNYEKIWTQYAERHINTEKKSGATKLLGDEWGTAEYAARLFTTYIQPLLSPTSLVAELGVGGGKYTIKTAAIARKIYGVDISDSMLKLAGERLADTNCQFVPVKTNGKSVNLDTASIDLFFSFDSMVHIFPYDLYIYLAEMSRFLKPKGRAVFEFADWDTSGVTQKFLMDVNFYKEKNVISPAAFGFISRSAIARLAEELGMKAVSIDEITPRTSVIVLEKQ